VSQRFGPVVALEDVSVSFRAGEVHAVLGENGAGKSTLMNVLAGFLAPDSGEVLLDGAPLPPGRPVEARQAGIEMVHQHFMLVPQFTVAENLALARLDVSGVALDPMVTARPALERARQLGWDVPPDAVTALLPVGVQQRIEILKAVAGDAKVVVFDEPTAVLSPDEAQDLLGVLRRLADEGRCVVLIAHKLSEVTSVADRVSVLRQGRLVGEALMAETDSAQIADWMIGQAPARRSPAPSALGDPVLRVQGLHVRGDRGREAVQGVDFEVRAGEVLGIGGVDGNGQVELAEALAGIRPPVSGSVVRPHSVAYVPQDRQADGLALALSIHENLLVGAIRDPRLWLGPFLRLRAVAAWARDLIERFGIKAGSPNDPAGSLSGGNQQKVVVARNLAETPGLVVAVNPTRGLDFRATDFVHGELARAAAEGAAVVLVSTDADELAAVAHRTLFLSRGRLVADLREAVS
jgi:general nucleoside transport system ATP-binding protein